MYTPEKTPRGGEIDEWLGRLLSSGEMKSTEVFANAKEAGISIESLRRAKKRAGIRTIKHGFAGGDWRWALPEDKA